MSEPELDPANPDQRRTLWIVLILNLLLTAGFAVGGVIGDSSALLANALDNGSDSLVFIISLIAMGRGKAWKTGAARFCAVMLLLFAAGILADAVRRFLGGSEPLGSAIMIMGVIGAAVNALCLWLLMRLKAKDVNLRAATTFSFNDFASNGGIFLAGALVMWTGSNWPDLAVGAAVAAIAVHGAIDIFRDAREESAKGRES
jgi:cobalt-zinc-cadmium efflux system protein